MLKNPYNLEIHFICPCMMAAMEILLRFSKVIHFLASNKHA